MRQYLEKVGDTSEIACVTVRCVNIVLRCVCRWTSTRWCWLCS